MFVIIFDSTIITPFLREDHSCVPVVSSIAASDISVSSLPSEAVPLSPVAVEKSLTEVLDSHQLDSLEEELLIPSGEVIPSLSVCANIHQAQFSHFGRMCSNAVLGTRRF